MSSNLHQTSSRPTPGEFPQQNIVRIYVLSNDSVGSSG